MPRVCFRGGGPLLVRQRFVPVRRRGAAARELLDLGQLRKYVAHGILELPKPAAAGTVVAGRGQRGADLLELRQLAGQRPTTTGGSIGGGGGGGVDDDRAGRDEDADGF